MSKSKNDVDNLAEARARPGFVHNRQGGPPIPGVATKGQKTAMVLVLSALVIAGGISAYIFGFKDKDRAAVDNPGEDRPATPADRDRPDPAERLVMGMFARTGGIDTEIMSGDTISADALLRPVITAPADGYLLLAHVSPEGALEVIYPVGTGGKATDCSSDKTHEPAALDAKRLAVGTHFLYLVHGPTMFNTQAWVARTDSLKIEPLGLQVRNFKFERQ